jgi:hypothetical protein
MRPDAPLEKLQPLSHFCAAPCEEERSMAKIALLTRWFLLSVLLRQSGRRPDNAQCSVASSSTSRCLPRSCCTFTVCDGTSADISDRAMAPMEGGAISSACDIASVLAYEA